MKMPVLSKCCCFSLKTGVKIISSLAIIFSILRIFVDSSFIAMNHNFQVKPEHHEFFESPEYHVAYITQVFVIIDLVLCLVAICIYSLVIYGIQNNRRRFLMPALVFILVESVIQIVVVVADVFSVNAIGEIIVTLLGLVYNMFACLVIFSLVKEIKRAGEDNLKMGWSRLSSENLNKE